MKKPIVYLDLDRTLFRTERMSEVWEFLAGQYPQLDNRRERERIVLFYDECDGMRCYDMSAHLKSLGITPDEAYRSASTSSLGDGRFEYRGVDSLIRYLTQVAEVKVLTYGFDDYQRFKAQLCPSLAGIPIETTLQSKTETVSRSRGEVWLVDDKPLTVIPGNTHFVQVRLDGSPEEKSGEWPVYTSISAVEQHFRKILGL